MIAENAKRFDRFFDMSRLHLERGEHEAALKWASLAGAGAWHAHAGFYADPALERLCSDIGHGLDSRSLSIRWGLPRSPSDGRRWLHVLTAAYMTGGHTRLAERWMLTAEERERHSFVLLNQEGHPFPDWLTKAAERSGGSHISFPAGLSMLDKAALLRDIAHRWADIVVLHIHPDDPVATVAFGIPGGPPVMFVNHAAQSFWFGGSVADTVIDGREPEARMSVRRRYAKRVDVLPMPMKRRSIPYEKPECKRRLGIDPEQIVLLTVADPYKFIPFGDYDFPKAVGEALRTHRDALLLVVGPRPEDVHWQAAVAAAGGRLRLYGLQPEPDLFYGAADLFLESFPFGSITAALDAAMLGIPVVLAPEPIDPILGLHHYPGMYAKPRTSGEYLETLCDYIGNESKRIEYGMALSRSVAAQHDGEAWLDGRKRLLESLPKAHAVGLTADAQSPDQSAELDRLWASMQRRQSMHLYLIDKLYRFYKELQGGAAWSKP